MKRLQASHGPNILTTSAHLSISVCPCSSRDPLPVLRVLNVILGNPRKTDIIKTDVDNDAVVVSKGRTRKVLTICIRPYPHSQS